MTPLQRPFPTPWADRRRVPRPRPRCLCGRYRQPGGCERCLVGRPTGPCTECGHLAVQLGSYRGVRLCAPCARRYAEVAPDMAGQWLGWAAAERVQGAGATT
jgi:hypothetical protein